MFQTEGTAGCMEADALGELPLHTAAASNQPGTVRRLLRCGAPIDAVTTNGWNTTALHLAASRGFFDVCQELLAQRANPLLLDVEGKTPARVAEHYGHPHLARLLDEQRRAAGNFEMADLGRTVVNGWNDVADGASRGVNNLVSSVSGLFGGGASNGRAAAAGAAGPAAQPAAQPPPLLREEPPPSVTPLAAAVRDRLAALTLRIDELASAAGVDHIKGARVWQDELTKVSCELDALQVADDPEARCQRRELLKRIDEAYATTDRRLLQMRQALEACSKAVGDIEGQVSSGGLANADLRSRLNQVAGDLDALECATDAQRQERKRHVERIEALEKQLVEQAYAGGAGL